MSGDYRAARQHWVSIERLETFPELGRVRAVVGEDGNVTIESNGVTCLSLHIATMPAGEAPQRPRPMLPSIEEENEWTLWTRTRLAALVHGNVIFVIIICSTKMLMPW